MFISTNQLIKSYGIDYEIAEFFVEREPPANNLYWHEKLLYLRPAPGYLFIPLVVDLLNKLGIKKEALLSESFVTVMEQIGHISALEESGKISANEAITQCRQLAEKGINQQWLERVTEYFCGRTNSTFQALTTPFRALHRGDIFLFSLTALPFEEAIFVKLVNVWFALISTLLLLDDAEDISDDKESGDLNAFVESGLNGDGLKQVVCLVEKNIKAIKEVNAVMAAELQRQCTQRLQMEDILELQNY
jgi:hypothetical protein